MHFKLSDQFSDPEFDNCLLEGRRFQAYRPALGPSWTLNSSIVRGRVMCFKLLDKLGDSKEREHPGLS